MAQTEIAPSAFEREVRDTADVVVLDIRSDDAAADWPLDAGPLDVVHIPLAEVEADPAGVARRVGTGRPIRVMCARGRTATTATELLAGAGADVRAVAGGMQAWSQLLTRSDVPIPGDTTVLQFRREARGCLSYLITSGGQALVVDPSIDVDAYLAAAEELGVRITHVLDTHVHADHLTGMWRLADRTGAVPHLSVGAIARGGDASAVAVTDGDRLAVGVADVRVVTLPGHTTDNVGLLIDAAALIGGDSLFAEAVARPDLEAGDAGAPDAARTLFDTIHERILTLPGTTILLPCHYPGGRRDGPIAPTLDHVRAGIAALGLDRERFASTVLADMPPRPANYREIIAANLGRALADDLDGLEVGANNCAAG